MCELGEGKMLESNGRNSGIRSKLSTGETRIITFRRYFMVDIHCVDCGARYPVKQIIHRCHNCGGVFDFSASPEFDIKHVDPSLPGLWKYKHTFSLAENAPVITLGEGNTPFFWDSVEGKKVGYKLENLNPTGSYKDRGTAVLISQLAARGITAAVEDSSGNAGASFAAYCARAGIRARVFVPDSAAGPKRRQIEQYGAELIPVPGPRSEAAKAVLQAVQAGQTYGSHSYLPFGIPGIATIAYELFEQTGGEIGSIIAPAGHGALLLGIIRGFKALEDSGYISRMPFFIGVQAENCSPMAYGFSHGLEKMKETIEGKTVAEGVRVSSPVRASAIFKSFIGGKGDIISIPEGEILPACERLAKKGIYAEPTSGLVWAAWEKMQIKLTPPIILIISGNGLKYYP